MSYTENAIRMKPFIQKAIQSLPDEDALQIKTMYDPYEVGKHYLAGTKFFYPQNGKLYKVIQGHTSQADWLPPDVASLYSMIAEATPTENGTREHPYIIPEGTASYTYTYGLYYSYLGVLYFCERQGEAPGATITLAYTPDQLIGHYFTVV